jgi:lipopolysaccharide biosynthesis protein
VFARHKGAVNFRVCPNRGRDIGPFLTDLASTIARGGYDVFGHVHGKQSLASDTVLGSTWREFLWENLVGGIYPMLEVAIAAFSERPELGLLIAAEPHLVGWDDNRGIAEALVV